MINSIIAYSIRNKLIIGLMTIALIGAGIWSMTKVPLDAVPDITNNQVQVITQAPNLGTVDIEQFVTYPVEVAMANLPGVIEIRSVSRFGLSVVTVVFEDDMGTYLPRQLVSEKLVAVSEDIPEGFGTPEMGPISTGLGEIYQYTLEVDSAHRDEYTPMDLRTIQDWIIRRQMSMVEGVVEVNAFGGDVKQYEVSVNPEELKAMSLTIGDVYDALKTNNSNTGGAYIEKDHYANFIRGEGLVRNLDDIRKIVVTVQNDIPITIADIATVQFGRATRYGAMTKDGKGEAVGGMILMLKDANSNAVIGRVKERIELIQKSLPEGVRIEMFIDRSDLIRSTTNTVATNLIEGALIVIFVLVILLGNWRGGLIVASTIPLSLLFAFILMNVFGVWANLMSLGAIDFGIIVDGAVIIVESTVFMLREHILKGKKVGKATRDDIAYKSSSKMMNTAFFGQLIILIVFIPVLTLEGVEGKMFKPMALTFMFAMIGAMVLALTYVPMMSSLFLRVKIIKKLSFGDKIVRRVENAYAPVLRRSLNHRTLVIGIAVAFFALAAFLFSRMGSEFIPQLDEGDIAFHVILKPGSGLTETIEATTKAEKIVLDQFPEVERIMSRIGVADVPTDPMPMDVADVIVMLKPRDQWTSAKTKSELVDKMRAAVSQVPGVNYEFTQPIEMRFNELLTGVREDIAVKLFGEDLGILAAKAEEMGHIIADIPGVGDLKVEATAGLPQITVKYDRNMVARYGLNIDQLNTLVRTAFAGEKAGVIFEGEKRFDLVLRLDESSRQDLNDVKNLYVSLPGGTQIPISQVAEISHEPGPMQISRDNTNRRTYVGINVRGRDIKSLVDDIRIKLDAELELPPGYYIRYGGAFENLERAISRLEVVVPVALGLIFLFIFLALKSVRQTAIIYIAIPLAAIGGVLSLWIRDMPFSISAGVGFIVLFGVAVLDGLILMSSWNELKEQGMTDIDQRIQKGARRRIRPIMLTALTDIFGFLPMAISTSAGAEVQRPLATVVIGGMITATLLTLIVLPVLYRWIEGGGKLRRSPAIAFAVIGIGISALIASPKVQAQQPVVTSLEKALEIGMANNPRLAAARAELDYAATSKKTAFNPAKTDLHTQYGQYSSFENDWSFTISQNFAFPTVYTRQNELAKTRIAASGQSLALMRMELVRDIRLVWMELAYSIERRKTLQYRDSLFQRFLHAAELRYATEESSYLEKTAAETQRMEVANALQMAQSDILIAEGRLQILLNDSARHQYRPSEFEPMDINFDAPEKSVETHPLLLLAKQQVEIARSEKRVESARMLPDLSIGYFNQSRIGDPTRSGDIATKDDRFDGIQAGISIPLFFGSQKAAINMAQLQTEIADFQAQEIELTLKAAYNTRFQEWMKFQKSLNYYVESANPQAELLIQNATKSFEGGAIGYIEYFQNLDRALNIKFSYLETLHAYNRSTIELEYLISENHHQR